MIGDQSTLPVAGPAVARDRLGVGERVGRFVITGKLGEGGMLAAHR